MEQLDTTEDGRAGRDSARRLGNSNALLIYQGVLAIPENAQTRAFITRP